MMPRLSILCQLILDIWFIHPLNNLVVIYFQPMLLSRLENRLKTYKFLSVNKLINKNRNENLTNNLKKAPLKLEA